MIESDKSDHCQNCEKKCTQEPTLKNMLLFVASHLIMRLEESEHCEKKCTHKPNLKQHLFKGSTNANVNFVTYTFAQTGFFISHQPHS